MFYNMLASTVGFTLDTMRINLCMPYLLSIMNFFTNSLRYPIHPEDSTSTPEPGIFSNNVSLERKILSRFLEGFEHMSVGFKEWWTLNHRVFPVEVNKMIIIIHSAFKLDVNHSIL